MIRRLDPELLADFEAALLKAGAAITEVWQPGLSDREIDELTRPLGLDLPDEARAWWRWHNGVEPATSPLRFEITPRRPLFDLAMTLEGFESSREAILHLEGAAARLQPVGDHPWIFFDCEGPRDAPVPIYIGGHGEEQRLVLPSIGEMVLVWIDLIEQGVFTTDTDGLWHMDFDKVPPEVLPLGVY